MAIVAGVDFGTLSVRTSIVDSERGMLGTAVAEYPLHRKREDPEFATQSHADHMNALVLATRQALKEAGVPGQDVLSIAFDTTGSTVVMVGENLEPLDDYYLWQDHRSKNEASEITALAHEEKLEAIQWCGGVYSSEWGFSKLLHWLRNNPEKRSQFVSAFEHCDLVAAVLCGVKDSRKVKRSVCAMGHKWLWNRNLGGLPSEEFLTKLDPLLAGVREKLEGSYETSDNIAGTLSAEWAEKLGLRAGIPIPVGAFDCHWDAIGAGARLGDVVNVVGTASCIMAYAESAQLVPGVCGVVPGSIHPLYTGVEAGLSAMGDLFASIARRSNTTVPALMPGLENYHAGQTGLLRTTWDNGDRTILVNPFLGGLTIGWNMVHTAQDELFAAIEGTGMHTRIILDRMGEFGVPAERVINGGGIPQKNNVLNQVYANIFGRPVLVPERSITSLGAAIFAFMAAGVFKTIEEAQAKICPKYKIFTPDPRQTAIYNELYPMYRRIYFGFGSPGLPGDFSDILPALIRISRKVLAARVD